MPFVGIQTAFFVFRLPKKPNLHYEARNDNAPHTQKRGARQDARSRQKFRQPERC